MSSCHLTRGRRRAFMKKFDTVPTGKPSWCAMDNWSSRLGRGVFRKMFRSDARCASVKTIRRFFRSLSNWIDFDDALPVGHDFDFASGVVLWVADQKTTDATIRLVISKSIFHQPYAQESITYFPWFQRHSLLVIHLCVSHPLMHNSFWLLVLIWATFLIVAYNHKIYNHKTVCV